MPSGLRLQGVRLGVISSLVFQMLSILQIVQSGWGDLDDKEKAKRRNTASLWKGGGSAF